VDERTTVRVLFEKLENRLRGVSVPLIRHIFMWKATSRLFRERKADPDPRKAEVVVDFSEIPTLHLANLVQQALDTQLDKRWESLKPVPNLRRYFSFRAFAPGVIECRVLPSNKAAFLWNFHPTTGQTKAMIRAAVQLILTTIFRCRASLRPAPTTMSNWFASRQRSPRRMTISHSCVLQDYEDFECEGRS